MDFYSSSANSGWDGLPNWEEDSQIISRFYSGKIDISSVDSSKSYPLISMRIFPTNDNQKSGVDLFPSRINPTTGEEYSFSKPNKFPNDKEVPGIKYGTWESSENGLFTVDQMKNFSIKVTNDNGSSVGNDFAFDNITLVDVTPVLEKSYENSSVRVKTSEDLTTALTFTIKNTTEYSSKKGWGFNEILPEGLKIADKAGVVKKGCGSAQVEATPNSSEISVFNGSFEAFSQCPILLILRYSSQ